LTELRTKETNTKPHERIYFHGKERPQSPTGEILPFADEVLAEYLLSSIKSPAGAFGNRNIPEVMAAIEILGIEQGRKLGVCTLNEYRKFLHLKQLKTFEEINPHLSATLKELYHHVDDVELYPGLVAEAAMPKQQGVGLAPGFTIVTAILSDAVALVRGDRFLTIEDTPKALTKWGYDESHSTDPSHYGAVIGPKLIHRHLSSRFPSNYVGTVFPFNTPDENKVSLPPGDLDKYTFEDPFPIPREVKGYKGKGHGNALFFLHECPTAEHNVSFKLNF